MNHKLRSIKAVLPSDHLPASLRRATTKDRRSVTLYFLVEESLPIYFRFREADAAEINYQILLLHAPVFPECDDARMLRLAHETTRDETVSNQRPREELITKEIRNNDISDERSSSSEF